MSVHPVEGCAATVLKCDLVNHTKRSILHAKPLSEATGLTKQQVSRLFDELATLIGKNLGEEGPGAFAIPGLLQIKAVRKPATEERKGINPLTKEETIFKAKPAKNVVKISPLSSTNSVRDPEGGPKRASGIPTLDSYGNSFVAKTLRGGVVMAVKTNCSDKLVDGQREDLPTPYLVTGRTVKQQVDCARGKREKWRTRRPRSGLSANPCS